MIAFLDASALIYLIEGTEPFAASVRGQLKTLTASNEGLRLSMSTLSRLECRIRPLKTGDTQILAEYDAFFSQPDDPGVAFDSGDRFGHYHPVTAWSENA